MQQFEPILHAAPFEFVYEPDQLRHRQAELRTFAAGLEPAARAARCELHAHRQPRNLIRTIGERHQLLELGVLLDDRQHALAELLRRQNQRQHDVILHAVAQQQTIVADVRQRGDQFGLRAALQAQAVRLAGVEHLFDDFVQLIHLDRIDRLIAAAVAGVGDRRVERFDQPPHSGAQHVLKPHQHRRHDVARGRGLRRPRECRSTGLCRAAA